MTELGPRHYELLCLVLFALPDTILRPVIVYVRHIPATHRPIRRGFILLSPVLRFQLSGVRRHLKYCFLLIAQQ